ncbi:MAG: hypothetical protein IPF94_06280 [Betaproteobacteria bacterium]|nr:hypothetical protein [Betaproteobacteria bacterium]
MRLSETEVRQRYAAPAEVSQQPDGGLVLLYPEQALSIAVAKGRRGVLQYVAPVEFDKPLRAPLIAIAAAPVTTR